MQARMKKYPLSEDRMAALLDREAVGRLATLGEDGYPYVTPVHFAWHAGVIYIHGLAAGEKLRNLQRDPRVGFVVDGMTGLNHGDGPCATNTTYESVIIRGRAALVEDPDVKTAALDAIVAKYTPQHIGKGYPANMMQMTAVITISVESRTGKYYAAE